MYKKFKTCKALDPNDRINPHTPCFPAADRETIQPNLPCKSTDKFLQEQQDRSKHKSRMEKLGGNGHR